MRLSMASLTFTCNPPRWRAILAEMNSTSSIAAGQERTPPAPLRDAGLGKETIAIMKGTVGPVT
jgi:hypothetical protein